MNLLGAEHGSRSYLQQVDVYLKIILFTFQKIEISEKSPLYAIFFAIFLQTNHVTTLICRVLLITSCQSECYIFIFYLFLVKIFIGDHKVGFCKIHTKVVVKLEAGSGTGTQQTFIGGVNCGCMRRETLVA
jgi:hypothetical protein